MENIYMPFPSRILDILQHTDIDYTFRMEFKGNVKPGQFFKVSIPKYGEAPISVSEIGEGYVDLTIRRVGAVTNEIHNFSVGSVFFMRGPYGNGFDVNVYKGKELIVAAGGTGLAPVKGIIDYFYSNIDELKSMQLIMGFKSPEDILFKKDIKKWESKFSTILTVDKAESLYEGRIGIITSFIKELTFNDISSAQAIVVGPPIMMKFTVQELLSNGVCEENIWVSYERKMCCGVGKCGHCKIDDTYICLEGPVFNFKDATYLID